MAKLLESQLEAQDQRAAFYTIDHYTKNPPVGCYQWFNVINALHAYQSARIVSFFKEGQDRMMEIEYRISDAKMTRKINLSGVFAKSQNMKDLAKMASEGGNIEVLEYQEIHFENFGDGEAAIFEIPMMGEYAVEVSGYGNEFDGTEGRTFDVYLQRLVLPNSKEYHRTGGGIDHAPMWKNCLEKIEALCAKISV